jgi:hypothetical protein
MNQLYKYRVPFYLELAGFCLGFFYCAWRVIGFSLAHPLVWICAAGAFLVAVAWVALQIKVL